MKTTILIAATLLTGIALKAQATQQQAATAYFIDGYHGGVYGHISPTQTRFMVDQLRAHPDWKINLELEPESWDSIALKEPQAYAEFSSLFADQTAEGRIEYINPAYGQSYLFDISGESIVRQFYYGMRKLHEHFPGAVFTTYSSEEPCFTSALPQILRSYGFSYASLKNPNTCWGGYSRAHGGELVDWIGPDGSHIVTVPRYAVEALKPKSTWETIASNNSLAYVTRALDAGIAHPVGMCLQDAGWANGPWIKTSKSTDSLNTSYQPTVYETWRGYIGDHSIRVPREDWRLSQEDVQVSLVWGGQILQRVAQRVRASENKIVATEKLAAMASVYDGMSWPSASLDEAWRTLLLSQHHDCWIVPYNQRAGLTWADYVGQWTSGTGRRCDSVLGNAMERMASASGDLSVRVFNTTGVARNEYASFVLPEGWTVASVVDEDNQSVAVQPGENREWLFRAKVPAMGYETYRLVAPLATTGSSAARPPNAAVGLSAAPAKGAHAYLDASGACHIETDLYSLVLDPSRGGTIRRLVAKRLGGFSFADTTSARSFGELRGNFYQNGGMRSSTETPAQVRILENGPLRTKVEVSGSIAGTPFSQTYTLAEGEPRIDVHLRIDWAGNTGIGESPADVKGDPLKKAFYNDSFKLQTLFPAPFAGQRVYKNAPFDVTESHLGNTFFDRWDSIKNVVVLNWVDVTDAAGKYGLAVFSDHTTSYAHGKDYPLGLTVQYSGDGLFYRNYTLEGPTEMNYAIVPHAGKWDKAGIWTDGTRWNEPMRTHVADQPRETKSLLHLGAPGWEVASAIVSGNDLVVRLFNAEGNTDEQKVYLGFQADSVQLVALDGARLASLRMTRDEAGSHVSLSAPRFGIRTLRFAGAANQGGAATAPVEPFHQGDRVAFIGNSITEQGYYESYVWLYYMLHFPTERITVFNTGIGGDRAKDMYLRFDDDVLPKKPTVACLTFGMNDSGYFEFLQPNADSTARAKIAESKSYFEKIEEKLKAMPNTRKIMIAGSPYDETMKNPKNYFPGKTKAMEKIIQFQEQGAEDNHWGWVDFFHPMTEINRREQKKDSTFTLTGDDRIHPGNAGHFVMAYEFLKTQGLGDKPVADISIDAAARKVDKAENCQITNLSKGKGLQFDYLAKSLPFPVDTLARLWGNPRPQSQAVPLIPFYDEFNREMLQVKGLGDKTYTIKMDGNVIGQWSGAELAQGINLAKVTKTPEYQQSAAILELNEERMTLEGKIRQYYWLQFDYFRGIGMKFQDDQAAQDSVEKASATRWDVASKRDNYRFARFAVVRQAWLKEMDEIVNEIYEVNRPKVHRVEITE
jgi:alpha-mannosidase